MMIQVMLSQAVLCLPAAVYVETHTPVYDTKFNGLTISAGQYYFNQNTEDQATQTGDQPVDVDDLIADFEKRFNATDDFSEATKWVGQQFYENDDQPLTLAALRLRAGLTQSKLASLLNTKQPSIARLEAGKEDPSFTRMVSLARALGASLDDVNLAFSNTYRGEAFEA